jgi:predicted PP-loop superfamily ATPase
LGNDEWLCEGRRCGLYDGRTHCCGMFSIVIMSKVFAKIDRENKNKDPYETYQV